MAIKIVTDSTSYIPEEFINNYDISVVSLNVIMNGESIREVDLDNETFYSKMEESIQAGFRIPDPLQHEIFHG